jgi:hypothetical protein
MLVYSLSNISLMLHLAQKELDIEGCEINLPPIETILSQAPYYEALQSSDEDANAFQVFQRQLTSLLGTIYYMLLKNLFSKLKNYLDKAVLERAGAGSGAGGADTRKTKLDSIAEILSDILRVFQTNFVYVSFVQQFFEIVFSIVDALIFNDLMLRKELCTFMKANEIDTTIQFLEFWGKKAGSEWLGDALEKLNHTQQAANLLLKRDKSTIQDKKERYVDVSLSPTWPALLSVHKPPISPDFSNTSSTEREPVPT